MALSTAHLPPPKDRRVLGVIEDGRSFRVIFEDNVQCLIDPEEATNAYAFSSDLVEKSSWITRYGNVLVVAGELAFLVVGDRRDGSIIHTLLCEYKGMRS